MPSATIPPGFRARPDHRPAPDDVSGFMAADHGDAEHGTFVTPDGHEWAVTVFPIDLEPVDGDLDTYLSAIDELAASDEQNDVEGFQKKKVKVCTKGTFCTTEGICVPMTICI